MRGDLGGGEIAHLAAQMDLFGCVFEVHDSIMAANGGEVPFQRVIFGVMVVSKNRRGLSEEQYADMLEMLTGLSAEERLTLKDPDFITEDEADLIYSDRAMKEPGRSYTLDEVFREMGIPRRKRS